MRARLEVALARRNGRQVRGGRVHALAASVGVATDGAGAYGMARDLDALLRAADAALYADKRRRKRARAAELVGAWTPFAACPPTATGARRRAAPGAPRASSTRWAPRRSSSTRAAVVATPTRRFLGSPGVRGPSSWLCAARRLLAPRGGEAAASTRRMARALRRSRARSDDGRAAACRRGTARRGGWR
jgi:hypothetical protein